MSLEEDLLAIRQAVGPKIIKTKEVETEQFSLRELIQASERSKRKPVTFGQFPLTIAKPKYGCSCPNKTNME